MDKKYTSLEHSIRNIMTESISPIGSDEFKGTPKAFLKPAPRIAPKKGDTHPDGTAVLAQRGSAKIGQSKSGGTMSEEEVLDEAEFKLPFETGLPSEEDDKKKKKEDKEKIKVPTATELTMKDVNTSTVDKLLQKQKEKEKEVPGQQLPYWAKNDPEALTFEQFLGENNISWRRWDDWRRRKPILEEAYHHALMLIGVRREKGGLSREIEVSMATRNMGFYSKIWRATKEWESKLNQDKEDKSATINVVLPDLLKMETPIKKDEK